MNSLSKNTPQAQAIKPGPAEERQAYYCSRGELRYEGISALRHRGVAAILDHAEGGRMIGMERRSREFVLKCEQIWPGQGSLFGLKVSNDAVPVSPNKQIGNIGEDVKYELKEGEGSLFENDKKSKETDADYNGSSTAQRHRLLDQRLEETSQERRFTI